MVKISVWIGKYAYRTTRPLLKITLGVGDLFSKFFFCAVRHEGVIYRMAADRDLPSRRFWNMPQLPNVTSERLRQCRSIPERVGEPEGPATLLLSRDKYRYREIPVLNYRNYLGKVAPPCIVEGNPNRTLWQGRLRSEAPLQLIY